MSRWNLFIFGVNDRAPLSDRCFSTPCFMLFIDRSFLFPFHFKWSDTLTVSAPRHSIRSAEQRPAISAETRWKFALLLHSLFVSLLFSFSDFFHCDPYKDYGASQRHARRHLPLGDMFRWRVIMTLFRFSLLTFRQRMRYDAGCFQPVGACVYLGWRPTHNALRARRRTC